MFVNVNKEATKNYYKSPESKSCDCEKCKIYCKEIKTAYPSIVKYLETLGVDPLRPLELMDTEEEMDTFVEFSSCQYVVLGDCEETFSNTIDGVHFSRCLEGRHPTVPLDEPYFVLECSTIYLPLD